MDNVTSSLGSSHIRFGRLVARYIRWGECYIGSGSVGGEGGVVLNRVGGSGI